MRLKGYGLQAALKSKREKLHQELLRRGTAPVSLDAMEKKLICAEKVFENLNETEKELAKNILKLFKEMGLNVRGAKILSEYIDLYKETINAELPVEGTVPEEPSEIDGTKKFHQGLKKILAHSISRQKSFGMLSFERNEMTWELSEKIIQNKNTSLLYALDSFYRSVLELRISRETFARTNLGEISFFLGFPFSMIEEAIANFLTPQIIQKEKDSSQKKITLKMICRLFLENEMDYRKAYDINFFEKKNEAGRILDSFELSLFPKHNRLIFYGHLNALLGYAPFFQNRPEKISQLHEIIRSMAKYTDIDDLSLMIIELLEHIPCRNLRFYKGVCACLENTIKTIEVANEIACTIFHQKVLAVDRIFSGMLNLSVDFTENEKEEIKSNFLHCAQLVNIMSYSIRNKDQVIEEDGDLTDEQTEFFHFLEKTLEQILSLSSAAQAQKMLTSLQSVISFKQIKIIRMLMPLIRDKFSILLKKKKDLADSSSALALYDLNESFHILESVCLIFAKGFNKLQTETGNKLEAEYNAILDQIDRVTRSE